MDLYDECIKRGLKIDSHCSDLYIEITEESRELISTYEHRGSVTAFKSNIDGSRWYDVPFAYSPYWDKRIKTK